MMRYSAMLFDLDQTLIIKKPDTTELIFSILRESGLTVQVEQVQRAFAQSEIWIAQQVMKENETGVRMGMMNFWITSGRPIGMKCGCLMN